MVKKLFCLILVLMGIQGIAQNWCPPGARWHIKRGFAITFQGIDGIIEMSYNTDTTVIGTPCKKLDAWFRGRRHFGQGAGNNVTDLYHSYYTYSFNNVIFLYNETNAFDTVVNFNAQVGDKWLKPRSAQTRCVSRPVVTVIDTGHVTINGFYLKKIKTIDSATVLDDTINFTFEEENTYVERILFLGEWSQQLFSTDCEAYPGVSDGPPSNIFRCYEDNSFPLYQINSFAAGSGACDSQTGIQTVNSNNIHFKLYPNPNSGSFQIELQQQADIIIVDLVGKTVYSTCCKLPGEITVETPQITPGAYILKVKTTEGRGQVKFIVK